MNTVEALRLVAAAGALALGTALPALADGDHNEADGADDDHTNQPRLLMPMMNSARGMDLFIEKGCYTCHSVNGVGGEDAAALDAHDMDPYMNPFDLAAKMWIMAPIMIPAQEEALGGQIEFTGDELANIIAFLHDDDQQHLFHEGLLSEDQMAAMDHEHGGVSGEEAHEEELGHAHNSGTMHDENEEPDTHGAGDGDNDEDDPDAG